ncbi:DUF1439 domain-containing protein [Oxalobacteraceae bacterium CAVE-383]|nr:DUF1439 domain-containing protein [Oxalobacteraceae bacterium CAVE-383]
MRVKTLLSSAAAAFALACSAGAALAGYNVWTGDYTFSRQELENGVKSRFPQDLRYMQVVDVRLSNPELALDPANNRIITKMKAHAVSPFLAAPVDGLLTISSGLKYDASARAVRLDRPAVERVDTPGMPPAYAQLLNDVGKSAAQQALADYPLYTFKPEELQLNGQQFEPGAITVTADGLKVEVRPL